MQAPFDFEIDVVPVPTVNELIADGVMEETLGVLNNPEAHVDPVTRVSLMQGAAMVTFLSKIVDLLATRPRSTFGLTLAELFDDGEAR
jgi:hypothetical protein